NTDDETDDEPQYNIQINYSENIANDNMLGDLIDELTINDEDSDKSEEYSTLTDFSKRMTNLVENINKKNQKTQPEQPISQTTHSEKEEQQSSYMTYGKRIPVQSGFTGAEYRYDLASPMCM